MTLLYSTFINPCLNISQKTFLSHLNYLSNKLEILKLKLFNKSRKVDLVSLMMDYSTILVEIFILGTNTKISRLKDFN